jgi:hypothetical protein
MFGPNQVGELIVGGTVAAQTTVATFVASAADKSIKVLSKDGGDVAAGKPFYLLQKTAGSAARGLNFEFSDVISPALVDKVTVRAYAPEVAKVVKLDGFAVAGVISAQRTYQIEIKSEADLSPENFEMISGYYVTGEILGSDTATTVRDGVLSSLNKNLARRGNGEYIATANGTGILITEVIQNNIPGKDEGRKLIFSVNGKVFNNVSNGYNANLGLLTAVTTVEAFTGTGTGKFATNFEFFVKGMSYDVNDPFSYPVNFVAPFYTSKASIYNVIQIKYFGAIKNVITERQDKVLTILVEKASNTAANNANTNTILASLRTAGVVGVPVNLAVV